MTNRINAWADEGTRSAKHDDERFLAEAAQHAENRIKAVRVIAAHAVDREDCVELLAMLGIESDEVAVARASRSGRTVAA